MIIVNKFSNLEIKINSLILLLREFEVTKEDLDDKQWTFYKSLIKKQEA
ncbi:hypothetical protein [Sphingobacterium composti Ten et al. 2007 non Yoo et al. 2007]|nr:hypothetical protein [Sphingobacterium composti Ten et al. 2007 non Yoo et al. 2007]